MAGYEISARLKQFIFEFVDSVELLEVLFFVRNNPDKCFSANQVSNELRSNPKSIANRFERLRLIGLVETKDEQSYQYRPENEELSNIISELADEYSIRRHRIFELIFSSSKNARQFANAFIMNKANKPNGESDG